MKQKGALNINATVHQMTQGVFNPSEDFGNFSGEIMPTLGNAQALNIQGDVPTVNGVRMLGETITTFSASKGICVKCLTVVALAIVGIVYLAHHFTFQESAKI